MSECKFDAKLHNGVHNANTKHPRWLLGQTVVDFCNVGLLLGGESPVRGFSLQWGGYQGILQTVRFAAGFCVYFVFSSILLRCIIKRCQVQAFPQHSPPPCRVVFVDLGTGEHPWVFFALARVWAPSCVDASRDICTPRGT